MRLANRIFLSFLGIIIFSTVTSAITGAVLISRAVRSEAISRVELGLRDARFNLDERLAGLTVSAGILARGLEDQVGLPVEPDLIETFAGPIPDWLGDVSGTQSAAGFVSLDLDQLDEAGVDVTGLADRPLCPGSGVLCLFATTTGPRGLTFAAVALNGNFELVSRLQARLFGDTLYDVKPLGTVTVFCGDTRVATTVIGPGGEVAVGTRVSDVVRDRVLVAGDIWLDRAFVVDEWYLSAYEPIKSPGGENIGILYVGVLEKKYTDIRDQTILILSLIILPALGLLLLGAYLLARSVGSPLSRLADAAGIVAQGDLSVQISETRGSREIIALSAAFSGMIAALRDREATLRQQNLDLKEANRDYQELLSFVTHELNNSIGSLLLNISLLAEDNVDTGSRVLSGEQREIVDQLLRDVERFRDMVRNYLSLSRLERGSLRYQPRDVRVRAEVLKPILERLDRWITHRGMRVEWLWPDGDVVVSADPALLEICYSNLLVNAIKYGGEWIRLTATRQTKDWELGVENGGPPIPTEKTGLLFQKFSRLVKSDDGAGLGLYLVRQIMDRHDGEVTCRTGDHTVFVLSFPCRIPPGIRQ